MDVDGLESGALATQVSFEVGRQAAKLHATVFNLLMLLVALHIAAVLAYLVLKRENLILPMLTGRKHVPQETMPASYHSLGPGALCWALHLPRSPYGAHDE